MRTTLAIDDDILAVARSMADSRRTSLGVVITELARSGLKPREAAAPDRNGVPLLRSRGQTAPVTLDFVNSLRDELP